VEVELTEKWFRDLRGGTLDEKREPIDLRIYKVSLGVLVDYNMAGTDGQIENQIRGIREVTTVSHTADKQKKQSDSLTFRVYEIKFELSGQQSRHTYRDLTLVPSIHKEVDGVKVIERGQVSPVKAKSIKEWAVSTGHAAVSNPHSPTMPTPSLSLQDVLRDWVDGSVQAYDTPMQTQDMAYHVMVPVDDLWTLCKKYYRGTKTEFQDRYVDFIRDGATAPVYIAVGRNGRIKMTGGEDLVWFAKKSGLQELPVFFSYQRQV
jgi:hypothetical protein